MKIFYNSLLLLFNDNKLLFIKNSMKTNLHNRKDHTHVCIAILAPGPALLSETMDIRMP